MTEHHFSGPAEDLLIWLAASEDNASIDDFEREALEEWYAQQGEASRRWETLDRTDPFRSDIDPILMRPVYDRTDWAAVQTELERAGMIAVLESHPAIAVTDAGRAWTQSRRDKGQ